MEATWVIDCYLSLGCTTLLKKVLKGNKAYYGISLSPFGKLLHRPHAVVCHGFASFGMIIPGRCPKCPLVALSSPGFFLLL